MIEPEAENQLSLLSGGELINLGWVVIMKYDSGAFELYLLNNSKLVC